MRKVLLPELACETAPHTISAIHSSGSTGPATCSTRTAVLKAFFERSVSTNFRSNLSAGPRDSSTISVTPSASSSMHSRSRHNRLLHSLRASTAPRPITTKCSARRPMTDTISRSRPSVGSSCQCTFFWFVRFWASINSRVSGASMRVSIAPACGSDPTSGEGPTRLDRPGHGD